MRRVPLSFLEFIFICKEQQQLLVDINQNLDSYERLCLEFIWVEQEKLKKSF